MGLSDAVYYTIIKGVVYHGQESGVCRAARNASSAVFYRLFECALRKSEARLQQLFYFVGGRLLVGVKQMDA